MVGVILFSLALMAMVRFSHRKVQNLYFKSLLSISLPSEFMDEDKVLSNRASLVLLFNCAIFVSLLVAAMSEKYLPGLFESLNLGIYLLILLSLTFFFLVKILLQAGLRIIFEDEYGIKEYILNNSFANMLLGILLVPLVLCILFMAKSFHPFLFGLGFFMILGVQLFKIFKGSLLAMKYKVNLLYFILYLFFKRLTTNLWTTKG